jgi:fructosamine-3-kinase
MSTATPLGGGMQHATWRVRTTTGTVIVKRYAWAVPGVYRAEADGLEALAAAGLPTPRVLFRDDQRLVLADLGPAAAPSRAQWAAFGRALARIHALPVNHFGWHRDTWLGRWRIDRTRDADGAAHYCARRFAPVLRALRDCDRLDPARISACERATRHLDAFAGDTPRLVHGDLWSGNLHPTAGGIVALDPSIHWSWPEADLYNPRLWGGTDLDALLAGYREVRHLPRDWYERCGILCLLHVLLLLAEFPAERAWALAETDRWLARLA